MSGSTPDRLYSLLPAIYRTRDAGEGQPLRALFAVLENELKALEQDVAGLYDNWFIETCEEWVVPYIGDLLRVPVLHTGGVGTFSLRAYIANVLAYRRRKGTAAVLEQMANDVTGWTARVVEFQQLLGTTQHMNHVRPANVRTPDLRDTNALELLGGPFENAAHTVDVRHASSGRGRYNIPNVGIFLWRLQSYWVDKAEASPPAENPGEGKYTFDPLGVDAPLFNRPQTETEITHIAEERNVPASLRRRPLFDELERLRQAKAEGKEPPKSLYFGNQPVFQIYMQKDANAPSYLVPAEEIVICNLEGWPRPPASTDYELPDGTQVSMPIAVAVDPVLGRMAFPAGKTPYRIEASYTYGFSGDVGGGPYDRSESLENLLTREEGAAKDRVWWAGVSEKPEGRPANTYTTLQEAVRAWNNERGKEHPPNKGIIAVLDSRTYTEDLIGDNKIILSPDSTLLVVSADWRLGRVPEEADWTEDLNALLLADGLRPVVNGDIEILGEGGDAGKPGRLLLNGLLIDGTVTVSAGNLGELRLAHCTVKPEQGGRLVVESLPDEGKPNDELTVTIDRSICGSIQVPEIMQGLRIIDSIIDSFIDPDDEAGYPAPAIAGDPGESRPGPATTLERSTIFGTVWVREMALASEVIFTEQVTAERLQTGCVRYSFVPLGSSVPRRFRCQPGLALTALAKTKGSEPDEASQELVEERLWPVHTSTDYGDPGYGQLSPACPEEIRRGAEDGSEMGVFNHLKQPQREANLRITLDEYLRFGMEAGIFYVN